MPQAGQLTEIFWQAKEGRTTELYRGASGSMFPDGPVRVADFFSRVAFEAMSKQAAGRAQLAAHLYPSDVSTSYAGSTAVAKLRAVSGSFFPLLGIRPHAGRALTPADDDAAAPMTVVASHQYWQSALRGDAQAIGRGLRINNRSYSIAGVLPATFGGIEVGDTVDLYTSIPHAPDMLNPESWLRAESGSGSLRRGLRA